jgi:hypothetical protein
MPRRLPALVARAVAFVSARRRDVRDAALFTGGFAIALHETWSYSIDRPGVLLLAATMMGLPAYFRGNGK